MPGSEIELKLRVRPQDLSRLGDVPVLAAGGPQDPPKRLEGVYYDTEDRRLRRGGWSLRVRDEDGRHVQTLKRAGEPTGPLFDRGEWEAPVADGRPDLAALDGEVVRSMLASLAPSELRPVFATSVRRSVRLLDVDGATIEAAIDQGEIRTADGRAEPVAELELELKRGLPETLYDVALRVAEAVPVRLETRAKADRGYDLAFGAEPRPVKAGRLDLAPDATTEEAVGLILRHCLAHMLANERCVLEAGLPEGVHQMRVALRRLRSALSLFRDLLPREHADWLSAETRWLGAELGAARDWDVFREELLAPVAEAAPEDPGVEAISAAAAAARARAYESMRAAVGSGRYTVLLLRLGAWLDGRRWRRQDLSESAALLFAPVGDLADALLDRRHRQARKRGAGFERLDPEARHELRIALKKLRYACEFFRSLHEGRRYDRYLKQLAGLQQTLGHLNDVSTAHRLVRTLTADARDGEADRCLGGGLVLGWHARGLADLEPELVADWKRFAEAKPFWARPPAPVAPPGRG